MGVTIRNYRDHDLEAVSGLRRATAAVDQLYEGIRVTEPRDYAAPPDSTPYENTFVAQDERGRIVGSARLYARAGPEQSFFDSFLNVHPRWREQGVERLLLERLWARAQERRRDLQSEHVHFYVCCGSHQRYRIAIFESFGLRAVCHGPHMIYQPLASLAVPHFPTGIEVRPYVKGRDDESAVGALNEAFAADYDFVPLTQESWAAWLGSCFFREDLNLVGVKGQEVVGLCLCIISEERIRELDRKDGYVDTLCVRPAYRRQGLGTALLLAGLHALREAGMESVTLDTETDNPTQAMRLYERVGFREVWRWVDYGREMTELGGGYPLSRLS